MSEKSRCLHWSDSRVRRAATAHAIAVATVIASLLAVTPSARAAGLKDEVLICRDLGSRLERLQCYDSLADALEDGNFVRLRVEDLEKKPTGKKTSAENRFGLEGDDLSRLRSTVASTRQLQRGHYEITLEEGGVWREIETSRRSRYKIGDSVTIKKGFFGSYQVTVDDTGYTQKVRRIR